MENAKKQGRYDRIYKQLKDLMSKSEDANARMCSIASLLHHKMEGFFWTGFYMLTTDNRLVVRTYQGPVACMELTKHVGVCWSGINQQKSIIVPNVHEYSGHIACDSRSKSEIVIPVKNKSGRVVGVLDVDSDKLDVFDSTDAEGLKRIVSLIFK
ncbi:MAG: GAF domain-containing protein [Salinivirgaceae bacterium]|jgi:L-methionine (R)-S-oxide reductase|nr:GAF domain-containing protein [Salinivirgaceae bacterium]